MQRCFSLTIFLFLSSQVFAQKKDSTQLFYIVDENPVFQGDVNGTLFREYVIHEIDNLGIAVPDSVTGRIVVFYVVDSTGFITDIKLLDSIGSPFDYEVVRIIQNSPQWEPGKENGKLVRTGMTFPIRVQPNIDSLNQGAANSQDVNKRPKRKRQK